MRCRGLSIVRYVLIVDTKAGCLTSIDRILIFCARVICDLNTSAPLICILEEVHIRTLVKSVVRRLVRRRTVEVMNVSEATSAVSDRPICL